MNAEQVSNELKEGYIFNINLPPWKTPTAAITPVVDPEQQKRNRQMYIGGAILLVLIVAIFMFTKKK